METCKTIRDTMYKKLNEYSYQPFFFSARVEKSKSSFGNWAVRLSNTLIRFYFSKKDAQTYVNKFNKAKQINPKKDH